MRKTITLVKEETFKMLLQKKMDMCSKLGRQVYWDEFFERTFGGK